MSSATTRCATESDANGVARVHRLSRAWYYGSEADVTDNREATWREALAEPDRATWLAELDGVTVGFLSLLRSPEPDRVLKAHRPPRVARPDRDRRRRSSL